VGAVWAGRLLCCGVTEGELGFAGGGAGALGTTLAGWSRKGATGSIAGAVGVTATLGAAGRLATVMCFGAGWNFLAAR